MESYLRWKRSLIEDFMESINLIHRMRDRIQRALGGLPQMVGQFRAYSLEEYIRDLIKARVKPKLGVYWNEDVVVWRRGVEECKMKFDVVVGRVRGGELVPSLIVEAKVDLDAPRLKALMLSSLPVERVYETRGAARLRVVECQ